MGAEASVAAGAEVAAVLQALINREAMIITEKMVKLDFCIFSPMDVSRA
jgi:hypothetical protein